MPTKKKTASQATSSSNDISVGRIAGAFGLQGEMKCDPSCAGRALFQPCQRFRAQLASGSERNVTLTAARAHKGRLLVRIAGVDSADDALEFAGARLYAPRELISLASNEYLDGDLARCTVYDVSGEKLGDVRRVEHYPASDMLVLDRGMIPLIDEFVKEIDIKNNRIVVDLPEGLLE